MAVRASLFYCVILASSGSGRALANDVEPESELVSGEESPELRALRLVELELFGPADDRSEAGITPDELPAALTSRVEAPPVRSRGGADFRWLEDLARPDIPVVWNEQVLRFLEFFRNDPRGQSFIRAWLHRMPRYATMIREKLREMELPEDILYVAMVESGFDPTARSHAGAVGMWQFLSGTGREYGLEQTRWLDERMDPVLATEAGASYLRDLYARFGTWELAFAAYNMGYGALLRAIRKYNTNDYWLLARIEGGLPFETTVYVAKIIACAIAGRNPERFGVDLSETPPLETASFEVPGGTPLSLIARAAQVEGSVIAELNPALRRSRTPPGEISTIRVPREASDAFAQRWTEYRPSHPAHRPYTMRFGEDLREVARRYQTSSAALRSLNEIEDEESVAVGTTILVPAVEPHEGGNAGSTVVVVPEETFRYRNRRRIFYQVQRDDALEEIASFFGVLLDDVGRWNNIDPHAALQPGMFIQLFVPTQFDLSRAVVLTDNDVRVLVLGSDEFFDYHESQRGRQRFRYRVQPGDTLSEIAERFGIRTADLTRINRMDRNALLQVGQEVVVYAPLDRVPARYRRIRRASDPPRTSPASPSPAPSTSAPAEESERPSDSNEQDEAESPAVVSDGEQDEPAADSEPPRDSTAES